MRQRISSFILSCLLVLPMAAGCFTTTSVAADEPVTINVYNWGQYISDGSDGYLDVNAAFTEATGIKVNYMTYDTNESLYTKLKTGGSSYDIIIPSDYMAGRLIDEGLVQKIDYTNIPNYSYIDEAYKNTAYDPDNAYSVPTHGAQWVLFTTRSMLMKPIPVPGIFCGMKSTLARFLCLTTTVMPSPLQNPGLVTL